MAGEKKRWFINVTAFTFAGAATSGLVGATLGGLGGWLYPKRSEAFGMMLVFALVLLAAARVLGWRSFALPRIRRQTREVWGKYLGSTTAALLWGLDVGLTFTTRFTFAGVSVLTALVLVYGDPAFGALLFMTFWFGRALPAWIAPLLMQDANATPYLLDALDRRRRLFRQINVAGLVWAGAVMLASMTFSTSMG